MSTNSPRAVFVIRETEYTMLRARHSTREQCRYYLHARGQSLDEIEYRHHIFENALHYCRSNLPSDWRQTVVYRSDFDRFLFGPEDVIIAVGQDGLVANIAKYLDGQPVFGINPDPERYDGILVKFAPKKFGEIIEAWLSKRISFERRTMVEAKLETGSTLFALNEIFVGHSSHQSARYSINYRDQNEVQSSSGLIVSSGTGATGWAKSIMLTIGKPISLDPTEECLAFFTREPFPTISTGTKTRAGDISKQECLQITSMMNAGGTIFADGIEKDRLTFDWGSIVNIRVSTKRLNLAVGYL